MSEEGSRRSMDRTFKSILRRWLPTLVHYLRKELSAHDIVLDLGCGNNSPIQHCDIFESIGVEIFDPYLEEAKRRNSHRQYIKADIRKVEFRPNSIDAVTALSVLEHLTKEEGYELIKKAEKWAKGKVIIATTNGYLWQDGYDNNPFQEHKSGWSIAELKGMGFEVHGIYGLKFLRAYQGSPRFKPRLFWEIVSYISQPITYYFPELSFELFAVKRIGGGGK
jgi:SAM-dependent methyltransferase